MKKFGRILLVLLLLVSLLLPVFGGALDQTFLTVSAQAEEYEEYEEYEEEEEGSFINTVVGTLLCFLIAMLIASLVIGVLKGQLKSVEMQTQADHYMCSDALHLTGREDVYTHTTTTRTYDPQDNSDDDDD